jgi:hypothetical protein
MSPPKGIKRRKACLYPLHFGKMPHRVIQYLRELGDGAEKTTSVICEDLDLSDKMRSNFGAMMRPALRYGALSKRLIKNGRNDNGINAWSIGPLRYDA